ncbi:MAG: hypothetical protein K6T85_10020 [Gorillibacterium sp.]|nr:hypothetical protein [Gorillibacterium sp.]
MEQKIIFQPLVELKSPVNLQRMTDSKIDFVWEQVEGAASYTLHLGIEFAGGSTSSPAYTNIKDNHIVVSMDNLDEVEGGISYSDSNDWTSIDPNSLLAFSNTHNRFYWSVEAFDADGNLLSKSNGYRLGDQSIGNLPYFYLQQRTMTAADQFVLERKYEEALHAYKTAYAGNKQDLHSLRMINRLLASKESFTDITMDEALKQETLSYQKLYAEVHPTGGNLFILVMHYYESGDWKLFNQIYQQYLLFADDSDHSYTQAIYAMALFKQGAWQEAEQQFGRAIVLDKTHRFIGGYLALVLHNDHSFERALELAASNLEYSSGSDTDPHKWVLLLNQLRAEAGEDKGYLTELNERMVGFLYDKPELVKDWRAPKNRTVMKAFLEALLEVR